MRTLSRDAMRNHANPLSRKERKLEAYNVYLKGKDIDTVFYILPDRYKNRKEREDKVKRSLVNHHGYNRAIIVKEQS